MDSAPAADLSREDPRLTKRSTVGETSQPAQPRRRFGWGRVLLMVGFLAAGFLLQYTAAVVSSFLVDQQGIYPSEYRLAWASWVLERFIHDPRDARALIGQKKVWPADTNTDDRPELRVDPAWHPFDASVWREQPGFAVELSGLPVSLVQCFEGGGFLGETWVALAPIKLRDPEQESSQHDAPTVELVNDWWCREWQTPRLRAYPEGLFFDLDGHVGPITCADLQDDTRSKGSAWKCGGPQGTDTSKQNLQIWQCLDNPILMVCQPARLR